MMKRRGFSVVELMVVLVLAALLLTMLLRGMGRGKANREVDGVAAEIEGGLRLARATSLNTNGSHLNVANGRWTVRAPNTGTIRDLQAGTIPAGVEIIVTPAATMPFNITFNANGSATAATNITVRSRTTNRQTVLSVAQTTGTVSSVLTQN